MTDDRLHFGVSRLVLQSPRHLTGVCAGSVAVPICNARRWSSSDSQIKFWPTGFEFGATGDVSALERISHGGTRRDPSVDVAVLELDGLTALQVAVRAPPRSSAISPKKSTAMSIAMLRSSR